MTLLVVGLSVLNLVVLPFIVETTRMRVIGLLGTIVLIFLSALWLISFAYWEIKVEDGSIHYKSLLRKKSLAFHDIKHASNFNHETSFYSGEGKKLFSLMTHDIGYDLFINCLKARNIPISS